MEFMEYANSVLQTLKKADIRAEIDDRHEKIGRKIRDTELMKVPYMLILGEKEMVGNVVSVRKQSKGDIGALSLDEFVNQLKEEISTRSSE